MTSSLPRQPPKIISDGPNSPRLRNRKFLESCQSNSPPMVGCSGEPGRQVVCAPKSLNTGLRIPGALWLIDQTLRPLAAPISNPSWTVTLQSPKGSRQLHSGARVSAKVSWDDWRGSLRTVPTLAGSRNHCLKSVSLASGYFWRRFWQKA